MKHKIRTLIAAVLALTMLCGCSGVSMEQIGSFLTGKDIEPSSVGEENPSEGETDGPTMAAEAVMNQAEAPEVLRLAYQLEYGLNPFTTVSLNNRTILSLLYEPLFVVNDEFQAEPVLASGIEVSDDGLTTTVTLRQGVRFHSGGALTADDVLYSYEMAKQSSYYGNRFYHIQEFTAQNASTLVITTSTSYENIALLLDFPIVRRGTCGPLEAETDGDAQPEEASDSQPEESAEALLPDGTGPFIYDGSETLTRFEDWWQKEFFLGYESAALTACSTAADIRDHYEYGQVNLVCTDPSSAAYAAFHNDYELWSAPTTIMQYIGFNHNNKVFGKDSVRACITYAIDRETIVMEDLGGFGLPASLPASPLSSIYNAGLAADYSYDMDTFQAMLEQSEIQDYTGDGVLDVYVKDFSRPLEGTMIVNAASNQRVATANRIADALNAQGFRITVKPLEDDAYQDALKYQNFDLYYGEIRMSNNFDMGSFFRDYGSANYGGSASSTGVSLCSDMLENSGNAYDLHKWVMDKGWICPVLFKSYAVYTTRGAASGLNPAVDWIIH